MFLVLHAGGRGEERTKVICFASISHHHGMEEEEDMIQSGKPCKKSQTDRQKSIKHCFFKLFYLLYKKKLSLKLQFQVLGMCAFGHRGRSLGTPPPSSFFSS